MAEDSNSMLGNYRPRPGALIASERLHGRLANANASVDIGIGFDPFMGDAPEKSVVFEQINRLRNRRHVVCSVRPVLLTAFVGICGMNSAAHADWADLGVSWRCDKAAKTFSIRPVVDTSSGAKLALQPGFSKVTDGFHSKPPFTTKLQCNLPGAKVMALVYARRDTYQLSLRINKTIVFENALFNSGLGFEPAPYQIEITSRGRESFPTIAVCFGNWSWDKNYDEGVCKAWIQP